MDDLLTYSGPDLLTGFPSSLHDPLSLHTFRLTDQPHFTFTTCVPTRGSLKTQPPTPGYVHGKTESLLWYPTKVLGSLFVFPTGPVQSPPRLPTPSWSGLRLDPRPIPFDSVYGVGHVI